MAYRTRNQTRVALGAAIEKALVGPNKAAAAFSDHHKVDFKGASPVLTLSSAGAGIETYTPQGSRFTYFYDLSALVIRPTAQEIAAGDYTEKQVEDNLDRIYDDFIRFVEDNRSDKTNGDWDYLTVEGRSQIIPVVDEGGRSYFIENIPLKVEVY